MTATGGSPLTTTLASTCSSAPSGSFVKSRRLCPPFGKNAAGEVRNIRESSLLEGQRGLLAAYASFAVDDDFAVLLVCQLGGAALNVTDRNQRRTEIRDLMLMRFADIEDEDVFLRIQLPF